MGVQVVEWLRAHATYAVDHGLNLGLRTFLSICCQMKVSMPEENLFKGKLYHYLK